MASLSSRTTSLADRRSANYGGARPRTGTTRAGDYEKPFVREDGSPVPQDSFLHARDGERTQRRFSRESSSVSGSVFERRLERTQTTTKEAVIRRRSPVKMSPSDFDRRGSTESVIKRISPVKDILSSPRLRTPSVSSRRDSERSRRFLDTLSRQKQNQRLEEQAEWQPSASLIPPSSAPLACRVSRPPLSVYAPSPLQPKHFSEMTMQEQESAILDDLLYVFMGYEGEYIRYAKSYQPSHETDRLAGPEFQISPGIDPSLRDLTTSMLKMAAHYCAIEAFVEVQSGDDFGSVNHALCAAIRKLLKDYLILIAQLEMKVINDSSFTLHQMHLSIIPTAQSLAQLFALAQEILKKNSLLEEEMEDQTIGEFDAEKIIEQLRQEDELDPGNMSKKKCVGGVVLALLSRRLATFSGDPAARTLLEMLLREASRPYVAMLNEWLHRGGIKDPHGEFLIGEHSGIHRERMDDDYTDEFWEKRYYVRDRAVPPQLESVKEKIMLAGKYLNVVRECGGINISRPITDVPKTFDDPKLLDNVISAYLHANAALLTLLLTTNSLRSRLRSLKHYYFLDQAEFFLYFLELSHSELRKPNKSVNMGKLQSLLDLVVRQPGSIAAADPFKEDVKVQMNGVGLTPWLMKIVKVQGMEGDKSDISMERFQTPAPSYFEKGDDREITGYEGLELEIKIPFPLSLIVSRKTVLRYQLLFRYTLALRHLEIQLVECWSEHSKTVSWFHKSSNQIIERWKRRAWTLRARMLIVVQQMLFFATAEVMEPRWQRMMTKVDKAEELDQLTTRINGDKPIKMKRTVDELMQDHLDMLDSCMKDLGLTQSKLLKIHHKLTAGCSMFATYTSNLSKSLYTADPDLTRRGAQLNEKQGSSGVRHASTTSTSTAGEPDMARLTRMDESLRKYEDHFGRHLKILIDSLNYYAATESTVLLGLCARLTAAETDSFGT